MQNIKNKLLNIQGFKKETISKANLSKSILLGLALSFAVKMKQKPS